ncbi:MAG: hypothetical protein KQH59_09200 [Desulfobulbaceae bacterium]|nr:hypothetical protein [Desulfobulbaceae bacterium]
MNLSTHHENLTLIRDKLVTVSTTIQHAALELDETGWSGLSRMIDEIVEDLHPTIYHLADNEK